MVRNPQNQLPGSALVLSRYTPSLSLVFHFHIGIAYSSVGRCLELGGLIIINKHREANWLINAHNITLRIAVVKMLPFLEPLRWIHTATCSCWSVSTVVHVQEEYTD